MSFIERFLNYIRGKTNDDNSERKKNRRLMFGMPFICCCSCGLILFIICSIVTLSLVPLYLPTKGDNINNGINKNVRFFNTSFAIKINNDPTIIQLIDFNWLQIK
ncbi:hypothetical protein I4U23_011772 [Adineta vaga]|nr:hypothetical protein I4U23_011772 [Adineta vaga]